VAPTGAAAEAIRAEIKRGALLVSVDWPISAAGECAAWLRELLR
jgi:transposase